MQSATDQAARHVRRVEEALGGADAIIKWAVVFFLSRHSFTSWMQQIVNVRARIQKLCMYGCDSDSACWRVCAASARRSWRWGTSATPRHPTSTSKVIGMGSVLHGTVVRLGRGACRRLEVLLRSLCWSSVSASRGSKKTCPQNGGIDPSLEKRSFEVSVCPSCVILRRRVLRRGRGSQGAPQDVED